MENVVVENTEIIIVEACQQGLPGKDGGEAKISTDPLNRLIKGSDDGLYVFDDLAPDPLAYYILAKS